MSGIASIAWSVPERCVKVRVTAEFGQQSSARFEVQTETSEPRSAADGPARPGPSARADANAPPCPRVSAGLRAAVPLSDRPPTLTGLPPLAPRGRPERSAAPPVMVEARLEGGVRTKGSVASSDSNGCGSNIFAACLNFSPGQLGNAKSKILILVQSVTEIRLLVNVLRVCDTFVERRAPCDHDAHATTIFMPRRTSLS